MKQKCIHCGKPATFNLWCYNDYSEPAPPFCSEQCFKEKCKERQDKYMTEKYGKNWRDMHV